MITLVGTKTAHENGAYLSFSEIQNNASVQVLHLHISKCMFLKGFIYYIWWIYVLAICRNV